MTENGGLYAYYKSFNRLVSELGAGALSNEVQVHYFIAGLNTNAVQNTNLNLHMHTFYENKPTSTVTDLYAEADKVISLSKTNSRNGVVLENVQVLETEDPSLNRETTALNSEHMMVKPSLDRETIALNSNPIRTSLLSQIQSVASANTPGILQQPVSLYTPRMVNILGRGNHQPITIGPRDMLKRPLKKSSLGRSRLQWLRRSF
jgi:hypothetical protein